MQVQSADGVIHEFPDGTDPAIVDKAMKQYAQGGQQVKQPETRSVMDQLLGVGGTRHQLPPERMVRDIADRVWQGITNSGNYVLDEMQKAGRPPPAQISDSDVSPLSTTISDAAQLGVAPSLRFGRPMGTADDLRIAAQRGYNSPAVTDLRIQPSGLPDQIVAAIEKKGARPHLMREVYQTIDELRGLPNGQSVPKGTTVFQPEISGPGYQMGRDVFQPAPATVQDMMGVRTALGSSVQSGTDRLTGSMNPTAGRAQQARNMITDYLSKVPEADVVAGAASAAGAALKRANADYAASKKLQIVDALQHRAELRTGAANSGQNINNNTRQEVKNFILNQQKSRGLSEEQAAAAERAVVGTTTGNTARSLANVLAPSGSMATQAMAAQGGFGATLAHMAGGDPATVGIATAAIGRILGKVARGVANASEERQFNKFRQSILESSPSAAEALAGQKSQAMNAAIARALLFGSLSNQAPQ